MNLRLSEKELIEFECLFRIPGINNKTNFMKIMLFSKSMKVVKVDSKSEKFHIQLENLQAEFKRIANNHNRAIGVLNASRSGKQAQVSL